MNDDIAGAVLDALPWGIVVIDDRSEVVAVNRTAREELGIELAAGPPETRKRFLASYPLDPMAGVDEIVRAAVSDGRHGSAIARPLGAGRHDRPDALCVHAFPVSGSKPTRVVLVLESLPTDEAQERATRRLARALRVVGHTRHQINNALMGIYGNAELLLTKRELPEPLRDRARTILDEARRVHRMIDATKTLTRDDDPADRG